MSVLDGLQKIKINKERPFITLRDSTITFSKLTVELLGYPSHVVSYIDKDKKLFAIQASEQDHDAVRFYQPPAEGKQMLTRWASRERVQLLLNLAGLTNCGKGIRFYGDYYPEDHAIIFTMIPADEDDEN